MKLVLFNSSVEKDTTLLGSFKNDCLLRNIKDFPTVEELLSNIENETISHVAFVYHFDGFTRVPFYKNHVFSERSKYNNITLSLVKLFTTLKEKNGSLIVDLLSCNLNKDSFKEEMTKIESDLGIQIRYSTNPSGNRPQGDWILESHHIDVKDLYFTENINNWNGILIGALNDNAGGTYITQMVPVMVQTGVDPNTGTPIMEEQMQEQSVFVPSTLPALETLTEGDVTPTTFITKTTNAAGKKVYTLTRNITWSLITSNDSPSTSFIKLEADEIFDGNNFTIDLGAPTNSTTGLFQTSGTSIANCSQIKNLGVIGGKNTGGPSPGSGTGIIVTNQCFYFDIDNCYVNTANIQANGGGIAGCYGGTSEFNNAEYKITNCHVSGHIFPGSGGIIGIVYGNQQYELDNNVSTHQYPTLTVSNCYSEECNIYGYNPTDKSSTDDTGEEVLNRPGPQTPWLINAAGGIVGVGAGYYSNYLIEDCFSAGQVGRHSGGIAGPYVCYSRGRVVIKNCYSAARYIGNCGGGIIGSRSGFFGNAYAAGLGYARDQDGENYLLILNCYSVGTINGTAHQGIIGDKAGGICGYKLHKCNIYNSYCAGKPVGTLTGDVKTNIDSTGVLDPINIYTWSSSSSIPNMNLNDITSNDDVTKQRDGLIAVSTYYTMNTTTNPSNPSVNIYTYTPSVNNENITINPFDFTNIWSKPLIPGSSTPTFLRTLSDRYPKLKSIQAYNPDYLTYDLRELSFRQSSDLNYTNPDINATTEQKDEYIRGKTHEYLQTLFTNKPDITQIRATKEALGFDKLSYRQSINVPTNEYIVTKPNISTPIAIPSDGTGVYCALENGDYTIFGLTKLGKNLRIERNNDIYLGYYTDTPTTNLFTDKVAGNTFNLYDNINTTLLHYSFVFGGGEAFDPSAQCLSENTSVLTPNGYVNITELNEGDSILTYENKIVRISKIVKSILDGKRDERFYPVIIPANSISENYPPKDCIITQYHSIKYGNDWILPFKNLHIFNKDKSNDINIFYNIELENFHTDHLVINGGLVVESLSNKKNKEHGIDWDNRVKNSIIL